MSVCVRHHADYLKAEAAIKWQRMLAPGAHSVKRRRERGVQIDSTERCLICEIVASRPKCESTASQENLLEIHNQRSADPLSPALLVHDDRVQLPHESVVLSNRANPPDDSAVARDRDSADSISAERVQNFLSCFRHRGPGTLRGKGRAQQAGRSVNPSIV